MSSTDNALAVGILATFLGAGYLIYKKFPNLFNSNSDIPPSVPLSSDEMAESPDWTKTVTDTTTTPQGDTIINYILEGSGKWEGVSFEGTDINPDVKEPIQASGETIIGQTTQGYNIYETSLGTNPELADPTQYEGYIGSSTPTKVISSSSTKTVVSQPTRDDDGLSSFDRLIASNKGISTEEYKEQYIDALKSI